MVTRRSPPFQGRRRGNREANRAIKAGPCNRLSIRTRKSSISLVHVAVVTCSKMMNGSLYENPVKKYQNLA